MSAESYDEFSIYLRGEVLIGDDYSPDQILRWFAEEEEGYANLGANDRARYRYGYHALNWIHGFSALPLRPIPHALGLGSAYGEEFRPILDRIMNITIIDPSDQLAVKSIEGVPVKYKKPDPQGLIRFPDESFDLLTCFGVLHHIPNVSFLLKEMGRVVRKGAFVLIREPAVSMGDWRYSRPGLTMHERGIPERLMRSAIESAGLEITNSIYCDFAPIAKLGKILKIENIYNSPAITKLDALFCKMFAWNLRYHNERIWHKVAPSSIYWVCQKR